MEGGAARRAQPAAAADAVGEHERERRFRGHAGNRDMHPFRGHTGGGGGVGPRTKENLKSTWRGASRGGGNELQVGVDGGEGVTKALVVAGVAGHSVEDG